MSQERPKNDSEFLDRLAEFLEMTDGLSTEELRSRVRELGIDPDELYRAVQQTVQEQLRKARLAWQTKAREERLAAEGSISRVRMSTESRETLLKKLGEYLSARGVGTPAFAVQFDKYKDLPEEDLRTLIAHFEAAGKLNEEFPKAEEKTPGV